MANPTLWLNTSPESIMFERTQIPFKRQLQITFGVVGFVFIVEIINFVLLRQLNEFGILPRSTDHLIGIFLAPFLHGSILHFTSNSIPLAVFTLLVLQHGVDRYLIVSFFVSAVGGMAVWLLGRQAIHIGASGVIFGYFGFLLLAGLISKELKLLLISLIVGISYGGLLWGVLPSGTGISWEGHLFGFAAGLVTAYWIGSVPKRQVK